jgi:hypothetical protein
MTFVLEAITENKLFISPTRHFSDPFDALSRFRCGSTERRVFSVSDVADSLLLWAIYGGWYSGVMIKINLDLSTEPFLPLAKVEYTESVEDLRNALESGDVLTKHAAFAHEGEWRLVFDRDVPT